MIRSWRRAPLAVLSLLACTPDLPNDPVEPIDPTGSVEQALCNGDGSPEGIDVSIWQGSSINWAPIRANGAQFAFARAAHGTTSDPTFSANWPSIRPAGMTRGAYHFFEGTSDGTAQADAYLAVVNASGGFQTGDLPPVVDVEVLGLTGNVASDVARLRATFNQLQLRTGRLPIIYTNLDTWQNHLGSPAGFTSYPVWLAAWGAGCVTVPAGLGPLKFWQYTSTGSVPGISPVDRDRFNGSAADLIAFAGGTPAPPATCDNNVPVGSTACAQGDPAAEYVCIHPELPSSQQWTRQACAAGQSCVGTRCQGASCPYASIQARVQPNITTGWTPTLAVTSGQPFRMAGFFNASGNIDYTGNTTLRLTGPGYDRTFVNDSTVTLTTAGTYTLRATCGGLSDIATITVAACPWSSIQVRVQPDLQTDWTPTITVEQGRSFRVGAFYNATGNLAPGGVQLSVTGPNGALPAPANGAFLVADAAGTYTVTGTCAGLRDTAMVTAQVSGLPDPQRFQLGIGHAWATQWSTVPPASRAAFDNANLDQIVKAGATSTNVSFDWIAIEPTQGLRDWSYSDQQVAAVEQRGLEAFAYTGNSPTWLGRDAASACPESFRNPPPNTDAGRTAFHDFYKALSGRYCGRVKYYEFWNEPNGCSWMSCGCGDQTPQQRSLYAFWLGQWYQAMREGCSDVVLAVGGLDCNWGSDPNNAAPWCGDFVDQLYANGAGNAFDAVALHPYGYSGDLSAALRDGKSLNWRAIDLVTTSLANHGNANRKLWLNEWGWATSNDTLKANLVTAALTGLRARSNVFEAQYLTVTDLPDGGASYGLVSIAGAPAAAQLQPRAAWFAFRDRALGPNTTWHGPNNPGLEYQGQPPTPQFSSPIPFWAPSGAWATHLGFPRAGDGVLGRKYGYYSAGTAERFGQTLSDTFAAQRRYCFRSTAQGGGDNTGTLPYQIGYLDATNAFVALKTQTVVVDAAWRETSGVCHDTAATGAELGRPIAVRFGSGAEGGVSDIWFDNLRVTSTPR